jgi:hypothetical protein
MIFGAAGVVFERELFFNANPCRRLLQEGTFSFELQWEILKEF